MGKNEVDTSDGETAGEGRVRTVHDYNSKGTAERGERVLQRHRVGVRNEHECNSLDADAGTV